MSNVMFDEFIRPCLKERIAYTKRYTDAFYKHHTCGSVYTFIPAMIDCGVDILNPVQPGVYQMECERLKADFGDRLAFWGGFDTQHLLPEGSEQDVRDAVGHILSVMDRGGGYILSPVHTIQYDVPAGNVIAIYRGPTTIMRQSVEFQRNMVSNGRGARKGAPRLCFISAGGCERGVILTCSSGGDRIKRTATGENEQESVCGKHPMQDGKPCQEESCHDKKAYFVSDHHAGLSGKV